MSQSPKPPWRTPVIRAVTDTHPHGGGVTLSITEGGHYTTMNPYSSYGSYVFTTNTYMTAGAPAS